MNLDISQATRFSTYRMLLGMLLMTSLLVGGVMAIKIVLFLGVALPGSIYVFPFTYVFITIVLEVYGRQTANHMVLICMFCLVFAMIAATAVDATPAARVGPQAPWFHEWHLRSARLVAASGAGFALGHWAGLWAVHRGHGKAARLTLFWRVFLFPLIGQTISGTVVIVGGYGGEPVRFLVALVLIRAVFAMTYAATSAPLIYVLVETVRLREREQSLRWIQETRLAPDIRPKPQGRRAP